MKLVYFDNNILRKLMDNPKYWNDLYDYFFKIFGQTIEPVPSFYLFFEYYGLKNLKILRPDENILKFNIQQRGQAYKEVDSIGSKFEEYFFNAQHSIEQQFSLPQFKMDFCHLVDTRKEKESSFEGSQKLITTLFGGLLELFYNNYDEFASKFSLYLAWNYFCNIHPRGISTKLIREAQLDVWNKLRLDRKLLPFGKIIDDFPGFDDKCIQQPFFDANNEDMVDAEGLTYLLIGQCNENGEMHQVNFLTGDPKNSLIKRIDLGIKSLIWLENHLQENIQRISGIAYRLDMENGKIIVDNPYDVSIPINL